MLMIVKHTHTHGHLDCAFSTRGAHSCTLLTSSSSISPLCLLYCSLCCASRAVGTVAATTGLYRLCSLDLKGKRWRGAQRYSAAMARVATGVHAQCKMRSATEMQVSLV